MTKLSKNNKIAIIAFNIRKHGHGKARFEEVLLRYLNGNILDNCIIDVYCRHGTKNYLSIRNKKINFIEFQLFKKSIFLNTVFAYSIRKREYDLIYFMADPAPIIKLKNNYIVTQHETINMRKHEFLKNRYYLRFYFERFAEKLTIRRAKHIITDSKYVKKQIQINYPEAAKKTSTINLGVDKQIFKEDENMLKDSVLIMISGNRDLNRVEYLEVLAKLHCKINCIGDLPELYINKYNINAYKHISDKELACLYNRAKVYLHLSDIEGFGLSVAEALSCRTKVIAPNSTALKEMLPDEYLFNNYSDFKHNFEKILMMKEADYFQNLRCSIKDWNDISVSYAKLINEYFKIKIIDYDSSKLVKRRK